MKKTLALILCILMIVAVCVSCGNDTPAASTSPEESKTVATESTEESKTESESTEELTAYQRISSNLSDYIYIGDKYNGRDFTILTLGVGSDNISEVVYNEDTAEEKISEAVNSSIKTRNNTILANYGVTIKEIYNQTTSRYGSDSLTTIRQYISDGDCETIQAINVCLYDCGTLALEGNLWNLYDLENINPENPWWEQYFNESVTINNQLYFTMGDIGINTKGATPVVYYNANLVENLGLDDPIELAENGTWTIDKAIEYAKCYMNEVPGTDEGITYEDEFGWAGQYDDIYSMMYGAGVRFITRTADGGFEMSLNTSTAVTTLNKVFELMELDQYICGNDYFSVSSAPMELLLDAFEEGRCIFYSGELADASKIDMSDIFGVLPVPKCSEEQEQYYSLINTWTCNSYAIASNCDEETAEFAAAMLDAMGYYSWMEYPDSLAFNYYEKMLKNQKLAREDSEKMLDKIFEARGCELGAIFQIGILSNSGGTVINDMLNGMLGQGTEFTSTYAAYKDAFEEDVSIISETFENLGG